jgi:hypothetical protein
MAKHKHHIIPKHAGGTDDPSNLIELSVEDHAEAHRILWERHGMKADFMAWKMLSGKSIEAELARIELAKDGFLKFMGNKKKKDSWRENISKSRRGKRQSEESKAKKSESLKKAYAEGRRDTWFSKADKSFFQANYDADRMAAGRRNSSKWKDSVTSSEYRKKKSELDPRSKKVTVNGVQYSSIRSAAKACNMPYSKLRSLLNGKDFLSFGDIR